MGLSDGSQTNGCRSDAYGSGSDSGEDDRYSSHTDNDANDLQHGGNGKKYPNPEDPDFNEKVTRKFRRYGIREVKRSLRAICFPKKYELQQPQRFVENFMSPQTQYKNLLVFHRIGAGKTCTAIRVGERWKRRRRILAVLPAALKENFRNELRSQCAGNEYLTSAERHALTTFEPGSVEYRAIIARSDKRIDRHYTILSYNKFVELYENNELNLARTLLIVDEVQNMVSEGGRYYDTLYRAIHEAPPDLRAVLLSATPMFDKPIEIALTLNLLRLPKPLPTGPEFDRTFVESIPQRNGTVKKRAKNLDMFASMIRGYVSYFRGASPAAFPNMNMRVVRCPMGDFQLRSYLAVSEIEEASLMRPLRGEIEDLPNNFFLGTRIISNIAFPNKRIGEHGWESLDAKTLENLEQFSSKFIAMLRRIRRTRGPVFVYSNFKEYGGIRSFARILKLAGWSDYSEDGVGNKRFAIWSGDVPGRMREEIRSVFNRPNNADGSQIKIILGSPSIKEGVSFMNVRQVHIMEPYWNRSRIEQVIGRASRFCSHKNLPEDEREVDVYIYAAVHEQIKLSIDEYILNISVQKDELIKQFERALKGAAVDCRLNRIMNQFEEVPIKCAP
jgi:superfamily II DNA or RNA helicase